MILARDRQFNIIPAHPGLKNYILYYNIVFPERYTFVPQYTLMPDACGTLSLAFDGADIRAELWGASTRPVPLGTEPNRYHVLLLIRFSPYGLYQITRQSQSGFADKRLSLADIDSQLFKSLKEAFILSKTVTELTRTCETVLFRRMETCAVADAVLLTAQVITDSRGRMPVRDAARESRYSERHLNRLFLTQIGINVKSYARLVRFSHVLKQLQKSPRLFAVLSQKMGYFDQAHFDKDFKSISGVTPEAYVKTMSDFYYDGTEIYSTLPAKEEEI